MYLAARDHETHEITFQRAVALMSDRVRHFSRRFYGKRGKWSQPAQVVSRKKKRFKKTGVRAGCAGDHLDNAGLVLSTLIYQEKQIVRDNSPVARLTVPVSYVFKNSFGFSNGINMLLYNNHTL